MSGYRDEIDAALGRVAALEAEIAELKRQLAQTPAAQAKLADLQRRRADAVDALERVEQRARRRLVTAAVVAVGGVAAFVGSIASLGDEGHPLNAAMLAVPLGVMLVALVSLVGSARRNAAAREVMAADRAVAEALEPAERVRVEAGVRVGGASEEESVDEAPASGSRSEARG